MGAMSRMDLALLILRLVGGWVLIAHGLPKWRNREKVAENWGSRGMPFPRLAVLLAYFAEVPVGLLYVVGLFTSWASVIMLLFMIVATWWSLRVNREKLVSFGSKGYDLNLSLLAIFLSTALVGGGAYSLDSFLDLSPYWPVVLGSLFEGPCLAVFASVHQDRQMVTGSWSAATGKRVGIPMPLERGLSQ